MRRRILLLVVGMTTLVVLAFAIPLVVLIRNNAYDNGLSGLRSEADTIARYLRGDNAARTEAQITALLKTLSSNRSASVQLPAGKVLGVAPPGGVGALPTPPTQRRFGQAGASPSTAGEQPAPQGGGPGTQVPTQSYRGGQLVQLLVPTFNGFGGGGSNADLYTIRVWASDDVLRAGQTTPLLILAGASVLLVLVGAGAGEILTRRIIRPLTQTAETATALASGDVTARAPTTGPVEVAEVGRSLNRLADRIDELIAEERETVADLSHRLRTPLTALRLDAEALRDPSEADRVGANVTALERMLTAVIHAARRPQREGRLPSCDATEIVGERVGFWSALTEEQGRAGSVLLPDGELPVRAGAEDLGAAVDALLENVVAHTPEGTAFAVRLSPNGSGAVLEVSDDGPGLPADEPVRGRSDRGSSGLGLDIARRCAEASGGSMTLGPSPSGGALITLHLGAP